MTGIPGTGYHLGLVFGTALSRVLPQSKVRWLKGLSLFLPSDIEIPTISPSAHSEVTSMYFYPDRRTADRPQSLAKAIKVSAVTSRSRMVPADSCFSTFLIPGDHKIDVGNDGETHSREDR